MNRNPEVDAWFAEKKLEGDGPTAKVIRFSDMNDVESKRAALEKVAKAWCAWRDGQPSKTPS